MNKNLSVSEVLKESWQVFSGNLSFIYYLFLPMFVISLFATWSYAEVFYWGLESDINLMSILPGTVLWILSGLVSVFSVVSLLFFLRNGKKDSYQDWKSYFRLLPKFIWVSILQGLMILVGLLFFIIPGIYLAVRYAFVTYGVLERPTDSVATLFTRAAEATKGNRGTIFLIALVIMFFAMVIASIINALLIGVMSIGTMGDLGSPIADFLFQLITTPFITVLSIIVYHKLTLPGVSESTVEAAPAAEQAPVATDSSVSPEPLV